MKFAGDAPNVTGCAFLFDNGEHALLRFRQRELSWMSFLWRIAMRVRTVICCLALAYGLIAVSWTCAQPAVNPFKAAKQTRADVRKGTLTLSDGKSYTGDIFTTRDKRFRIYNRETKEYRDVDIRELAEIQVTPDEEHDEKDWRWKEGGSDEKVYTGKTYPWRLYCTTLVLQNGEKLAGDLAAPIYVLADGEKKDYILHKRDKGPVGMKLSELLYVKKVVFEKPQEAAAERKEGVEKDTKKPDGEE